MIPPAPPMALGIRPFRGMFTGYELDNRNLRIRNTGFLTLAEIQSRREVRQRRDSVRPVRVAFIALKSGGGLVCLTHSPRSQCIGDHKLEECRNDEHHEDNELSESDEDDPAEQTSNRLTEELESDEETLETGSNEIASVGDVPHVPVHGDMLDVSSSWGHAVSDETKEEVYLKDLYMQYQEVLDNPDSHVYWNITTPSPWSFQSSVEYILPCNIARTIHQERAAVSCLVWMDRVSKWVG